VRDDVAVGIASGDRVKDALVEIVFDQAAAASAVSFTDAITPAWK